MLLENAKTSLLVRIGVVIFASRTEKSILSVPDLKSLIVSPVSLKSMYLKVSMLIVPAVSPVSVSAPKPPIIKSAPSPPFIVSFPDDCIPRSQ